MKIVYISKFSQFRSRGGVIENQFFPKFKKVQIILGEGGGQENYGLFPQIMVFFILNRPLSIRTTSEHVLYCFHMLAVGGWFLHIIMPLCGPTCKFRTCKIQTRLDSKLGRVWQNSGPSITYFGNNFAI